MVTHSSATTRQQTSHVNRTTRTATNDPWLAELVRHGDAPDEDDASRRKIEALAEIICGAGEQSAAALFVLMGTLQDSSEPEALANTVKHFAFTRCGEFNVFGMVDAQIAVIEGELLSGTVTS